MNILDEKANNLPKKLFSTKNTKITKETKAIFVIFVSFVDRVL